MPAVNDLPLFLVPTDFSDAARRALDLAIDDALGTGARIELMHAWQLPAYFGVDALLTADTERQIQRGVDGSLAKLAGEVRERGVECRTFSTIGAAWTEIVRRADAAGADRIVMGTHGRTGLSHAIVGSVAERVVQHASVPVLVVPPSRDSHR